MGALDEPLSPDEAELELAQRQAAFKTNRQSRQVANALRIAAGVVGVALLGVAAAIAWRTTQGVINTQTGIVGGLGLALLVGALKTSPADLRTSTPEFPARDGALEQQSDT